MKVTLDRYREPYRHRVVFALRIRTRVLSVALFKKENG